jgi:hypothetical protein
MQEEGGRMMVLAVPFGGESKAEIGRRLISRMTGATLPS